MELHDDLLIYSLPECLLNLIIYLRWHPWGENIREKTCREECLYTR